jgi:hypothetical protein
MVRGSIRTILKNKSMIGDKNEGDKINFDRDWIGIVFGSVY